MDSKKEFNVIDLYIKERKYERSVFGDYRNTKSLSFPSFLVFLKQYVDKAYEAYADVWTNDLPPWLLNCEEFENNGIAPVKAYEEVIKIMALAGAALESYTEIDAEMWRTNPEEDSKKWKENSGKGGSVNNE